MGGAQPLAATMNGASMIAVECNMQSIESRLRTRYLDAWADNLDDALNAGRGCPQQRPGYLGGFAG